MSIWTIPISLEVIAQFSDKNLGGLYDIQFTDVGDDYLVATLPVDAKSRQPGGILHGGVSCMLAETVGSVAANFCVDFSRYHCVGLEINANHIRPMREGLIIAKATPFHIGATTQVWDIPIRNESDKLVCISRLTMAVVKR